MAALHAEAFAPERCWSASEFAGLLASGPVFALTRDHGFGLIREIGDEAELLTLAVAIAYRRRGIASQILRDWCCRSPGKTAFLEVAADNLAAQNLYMRHGFARSGLRKSYYARLDAANVDAVIMRATLTQDHLPQTTVFG